MNQPDLPELPGNDPSAQQSGLAPVDESADWLAKVRSRTPARIFAGRSGVGYRTRTQLELRRDHAAALDAVHADLDIERDWGVDFVQKWGLFQVTTQAQSKQEYLLRPASGRSFAEAARSQIQSQCERDVAVQIVIGDGLSAAAVIRQVPRLLPQLMAGAQSRGWKTGRPFAVRHCRVGIMNDVGALLAPRVVILLVGERPGLATAESLSAYFGYSPRSGDTDAQRNLISNIHERGVTPDAAIPRILNLAGQILEHQRSGVLIKEQLVQSVSATPPSIGDGSSP